MKWKWQMNDQIAKWPLSLCGISLKRPLLIPAQNEKKKKNNSPPNNNNSRLLTNIDNKAHVLDSKCIELGLEMRRWMSVQCSVFIVNAINYLFRKVPSLWPQPCIVCSFSKILSRESKLYLNACARIIDFKTMLRNQMHTACNLKRMQIWSALFESTVRKCIPYLNCSRVLNVL